MITLISLITALLFAAALPITGFVRLDLWLWAAGAVLAALLWLLGLRVRYNAYIHVGFIALLGLDVVLLVKDQPAVFGLVGGLAALAAWDLSRFYHRMALIHPPEAAKAAEKQRLIRLAGVIAVGLLLGGLTTILHLTYNFVPAFFLGLLALIGLRLVFRILTGLPK